MLLLNTLNQLLKQADTRDTIIQDNHVVDWNEFRRHVSAWQMMLQNRSEKNWALYTKDTGIFLAALLGAWCANKTVYLPSDALPATRLALLPLVDGFLGDFNEANISNIEPTDCVIECEISANATTVFFTSGSTGQPKPIVKTIAQLMSEIETLQQQFGQLFKNTAVYASVSHQHFYGFIFRALLPLIMQQPISNRLIEYPENLLSLPKRPYLLISSPAFLSRISAHTDWPTIQPYLQAIFTAGGVLKTEHAQHAKDSWGQTAIEIYGSTETGAVAYRKGQALFTPLPNVQMSVSFDNLLCITCPYLEQPTVPFETSDLAQIESNGNFSLQGRADRIVKIEEKRISLTQIEQLLNADTRIVQSHVVPLYIKQRLILGVVTTLTLQGQIELAQLGRRPFIETLQQPLKVSIERLAIPKRWRFVDAIPVNPQGKTEFNTLSSILENPAPVCFPTITSTQVIDTEVVLELITPIDLLYFQGHFKEQAILPGVVQVDWVQHYARQFFASDITLQHSVKQIKQLKFQKIIIPLEPVTLRMSYMAEKSTLQFSYTSPDSQHSSGLMVWSHDE